MKRKDEMKNVIEELRKQGGTYVLYYVLAGNGGYIGAVRKE